ncbi:MAG TPA: Ig-like domain-containing protein [Bacteroidales bacterium]|nr:Ig-like domain-containing protein [Bacteroidales bacterium]
MDRFKILWIGILLFTGCAKIVAPVGGPRDTTPPKVVKETPLNGSVNFNSQTIKITFNEFVTLNNPLENIIFSPPLSQSADYSIKGKSVIITWKDTLSPNTTYSLVFADAIKDYNEGNLLNLYQYAFSTGTQIDTVKLSGTLKNAESRQPEKGVFVFLYNQNTDSLPYTNRPTYLTKTNENGAFTFQNIKQESYKIFALKDINSNLIFDLQNEGIAFSNETVIPDTNLIIELAYFIEKDTVQKILTPINQQKGAYLIPLKIPCDSENSIKTTILYPEEILHQVQLNKTMDTISYFFYQEFSDSVVVEVNLSEWDKTDTLTFLPYKPPFRVGRTKLEPKLNLQTNYNGDLYAPLTLNFSFPIQPAHNIETIIIKKGNEQNDTITERFQIDGKLIKSFPIPYTFEPKTGYEILFRDSLFFGWDGTTNDSLFVKFTTKNERDYGSLTMTYNVPEGEINYVIYLLDETKKVIQQNTISKSQLISYRNLTPGSYKIKVIVDRNSNGKWDTGSYKNKTQPERILFFEKPISIRAFWDLEETFDIR